MTPEEKSALLQFMGMTYGHSHKLDTHIVGNSQFVKPISTTVKQAFEQVLRSDTSNNPSFSQEQQPASYQEAPTPIQITPDVNTASEFIVEQTTPVAYNNAPNSLDIIAQQLIRIGDILETITKNNNVGSRKKIKDKI